MKRAGLYLLIVFFLGFTRVNAQEAESNTVAFKLNNTVDTQPPQITILSPQIGKDNKYYADLKEIEILGEVKDDSKIRFVSVNTDIRMVNETGIFASLFSLDPGENLVHLKAMDEHSNMQDQYITIVYNPPVVTLADRIKTESKYYGLLIGIDKYQEAAFADLANPIKDAEKLYKVLLEKYTFEPDNLHMLKNPTRREIIRGLDMVRKEVTPADNLLIFYAGHGYWDEEANIGYWLPSDATQESTADWFRNSTLVDYLQAIHTRHTLLITDACFAGSIFKARSVNMNKEMAYERIYEMPSRKAMTSGTLDEVPDQSAFIKYLIQRLYENNETYLSSEELFSSFWMAVVSNSSVVPQYGEIQNVGNEGGDFIFLKKK